MEKREKTERGTMRKTEKDFKKLQKEAWPCGVGGFSKDFGQTCACGAYHGSRFNLRPFSTSGFLEDLQREHKDEKQRPPEP